jgi:hypothetical protein
METGKWQMKSNDIEVLNKYIEECESRINDLEQDNLILRTRLRFFEEDNKRVRNLSISGV